MKLLGVLAILSLAACEGPQPAAAQRPPDAAPVVDAAPVPDAAPPVPDLGLVDAAADEGPPVVGFRIVAGAAIVEADPVARAARPRPAAVAPASAAPASNPIVAAAAPRLSAMQTIRAHQGDVHGCYAPVALKDSTVAGRIMMQWTIGKDGLPMATAVAQDTLKDKSVSACIKAKSSKWRFPPPMGGTQVISYPFDLRVQ